jgi:hypothetical protein
MLIDYEFSIKNVNDYRELGGDRGKAKVFRPIQAARGRTSRAIAFHSSFCEFCSLSKIRSLRR